MVCECPRHLRLLRRQSKAFLVEPPDEAGVSLHVEVFVLLLQSLSLPFQPNVLFFHFSLLVKALEFHKYLSITKLVLIRLLTPNFGGEVLFQRYFIVTYP